MYDYIELRIIPSPNSETITDLLAAFLAEIDYESFVPDQQGLNAYIRKDLFNVESLESVLADFPMETTFRYETTGIKGEDWNLEWEKNYFKPILIDRKCVIRSSFHNDAPEAPLEIIIDPKMAFGTGHHFTTANMIRLILSSDLKGKDVIDMGSGTGILAILCKKLGARDVTGIEIDPFALENAIENSQLNEVKINWEEGDVSKLENVRQVDLFLANINLNVILSDISQYAAKLKADGLMFLSGFYISDLSKICDEAKKNGLMFEYSLDENQWVAAKFRKKN